jgi:sporadic carbohydrate cluster protein (TIGR04323 family)
MKQVRGYIFSRPFMGERVPQHIQNLVIRDYCQKKNLNYLLSLTEYAMPGCQLILNQAINELNHLDGIVAYSLFQLPEVQIERELIIKTLLNSGKTFHFAVEGLQLGNKSEHLRIEILWQLRQTIPRCLKTTHLDPDALQ